MEHFYLYIFRLAALMTLLAALLTALLFALLLL